MSDVHILNATLVNEGKVFMADVTVKNGLIHAITPHKSNTNGQKGRKFITFSKVIDAQGKHLLPGVIDDQVHFRDPGLTHKGDLVTESKAAVAGGVTSFMEMPNTNPQTITKDLLEKKYSDAANRSFANFSFYMGATNSNYEELVDLDPSLVCGIKVFMGASTGNMLVDNLDALNRIFALKDILIATHCEDESIIKKNIEIFKARYGDDIPIECHPLIRSREACLSSTLLAVSLAKKHNTRLHVLHLSTADELKCFESDVPLKQKRITAEVCVHHLIFNNTHYDGCGRLIKWNPSIKNKTDQTALLRALKNDTIDVVATDHAPHTYEEKQQPYLSAASGGPMVQHSLVAMLNLVAQKKIALTKVVEKMCHAPAECFRIDKRGFIREGYYADLVLVDMNAPWKVSYDNILYKCKWSPLTGETFNARVTHTFVNGHLVYNDGLFDDSVKGMRLRFRTD